MVLIEHRSHTDLPTFDVNSENIPAHYRGVARRLRNTLQFGLGTPVSPINPAQDTHFGETEMTVLGTFAALIATAFESDRIPAGRLDEFPTLRKYLQRQQALAGGGRPSVPVTVAINNPTTFEKLPQVVISSQGMQEVKGSFGQEITLRRRGTPYISLQANNRTTTPWTFDLSTITNTDRYLVLRITYVVPDSPPVERVIRCPLVPTTRIIPDLAAVPATALAEALDSTLRGSGVHAWAVALDAARTQYRLDLRVPEAARVDVDGDTPDTVAAAFALGARRGLASIAVTTGGTTYTPRWLATPTSALPTTFVPGRVRLTGVSIVNGYPQDGVFTVNAVDGAGANLTYTSSTGQAVTSGAMPVGAALWIGQSMSSLDIPAVEELTKVTQHTLRVDVIARDENQRREVVAYLHTLFTTFFGDALLSWAGSGIPRPFELPSNEYRRRAWVMHLAAPVSSAGRGEINVASTTADGLMPLSVDGFGLTVISHETLSRELYLLGSDTSTVTRTVNTDQWSSIALGGWARLG